MIAPHQGDFFMHKLIRSHLYAGVLLWLMMSTAFAAQVLVPDADEPDLVPTGKGWGERADHAPPRVNENASAPGHAKPSGNNGISYHGGPLILGTTHAYYIWYGNWSGNTATTILDNLASSIGGSLYFAINTTYSDGSNNHVSNAVTLAGSTTDNYLQGTALSDAAVQSVVASAISSGRLPKETNAVYFVLTSADVNETSGFCTQYCGWHTHATISGSDIKYSFVGNPDRCPSACEAQTTSPNNNAGADGMASIISHELEEAVTDPDLNAWYDRRGQENADKCAWTFGATPTASNGSAYNMVLGGSQYLIQQNWVNASGGYCAKSYP
jgi:Phosphate-induced protein 1 conserved region